LISDRNKRNGQVAEGALPWGPILQLMQIPFGRLCDEFMAEAPQLILPRIAQQRYRNEIQLFGNFLNDQADEMEMAGGQLQIGRYLRWREALSPYDSPTGVTVAASITRLFTQYLIQTGHLEYDPFDRALPLRIPADKLLNEGDDRLLSLEKLPRTNREEKQDYALLRLLMVTATGLTSLLRLNLLPHNSLSILTLDGLIRYRDRQQLVRHLVVDHLTMEAVDEWLHERSTTANIAAPEAIFLSRSGRRMTVDAFGKHMKRIRQLHGFELPGPNDRPLLNSLPGL
jgi:site-specific recombinase XerC